MSRSTRGVLPDAQLRTLSDEHILDFLTVARRGLAHAGATGEAAAYVDSIATLELEATRRGLAPASQHERMPQPLVLRRLEATPPGPRGEWPKLLRELDLAGLWAAYLFAREMTPQGERVAALAQVALAVDGIVYGETAAWAMHMKHVELPRDSGTRLLLLNESLERTFRAVFTALSEGDERS